MKLGEELPVHLCGISSSATPDLSAGPALLVRRKFEWSTGDRSSRIAAVKLSRLTLVVADGGDAETSGRGHLGQSLVLVT